MNLMRTGREREAERLPGTTTRSGSARLLVVLPAEKARDADRTAVFVLIVVSRSLASGRLGTGETRHAFEQGASAPGRRLGTRRLAILTRLRRCCLTFAEQQFVLLALWTRRGGGWRFFFQSQIERFLANPANAGQAGVAAR